MLLADRNHDADWTRVRAAKRCAWVSMSLVALLLLTSCADFQARMAAQQAANAQAAAVQQQAVNDADDVQCRSYGAKGAGPFWAGRGQS
jgi:hypothetical protein